MPSPSKTSPSPSLSDSTSALNDRSMDGPDAWFLVRRRQLAQRYMRCGRHAGWIFRRDDLGERRRVEIAEPQGRVGVAAGATVDDAGGHHLDGGEKPHARTLLVDIIDAADLQRQPSHVRLGNEAAPVVVEALGQLDGDAFSAEAIE